MTSNRIFSLNDIATDFAVEELEPRMEMQMLGLGGNPGIFTMPTNGREGGFIILFYVTIWTTYGTWIF